MSEESYTFNFSFLKLSVWITVILAILKLTNVINISNWLVFLPVIISISWIFILLFLIGLFTVLLVSSGALKLPGINDEDTKTGSEEES